MRFLLVLMAMAAASLPAVGQCKNGRCYSPAAVVAAPVAYPSATVGAAAPLVETHKTDRAEVYRLTFNGATVGHFDRAEATFTDANGYAYSTAVKCAGCDCGCANGKPPAVSAVVKIGQLPPTGVKPGALDPTDRDHYEVNGREVPKAAALQSLAAGADLTDDSKHLRLTVIGADDFTRSGVVAAIKALPAEVTNGVLIADYPADHWAVKGMGFKADGRPAIYLQASTGKVLHRQDDFEGGAERVAGAIRKAKPDYRPEMDPDLSKPKPTPPPAPVDEPKTPAAPTPAAPSLPPVNLLTLALIGVVAYLFFTRKGK